MLLMRKAANDHKWAQCFSGEKLPMTMNGPILAYEENS